MMAVLAEIFILSHNPFHWCKLWNCPLKSLHFCFWLWRNWKENHYIHTYMVISISNASHQKKNTTRTTKNTVKNTQRVWNRKCIAIFESFQEIMQPPINGCSYLKHTHTHKHHHIHTLNSEALQQHRVGKNSESCSELSLRALKVIYFKFWNSQCLAAMLTAQFWIGKSQARLATSCGSHQRTDVSKCKAHSTKVMTKMFSKNNIKIDF